MRRIPSQLISVAVLFCALFVSNSVFAQREYQPHFDIGAKAGMTMSKMAFTPGIDQAMVNGITGGITFRYTEERFFGLIGEIDITQCGWKETFDETEFNYHRQLTYVQIPLLTHIYFGSDKFKGFVNLGPSFSYMIGESISSNFDYANPSSVEGFPIDNRHVNQMSMDIKNKFDYGILAGLGVELILKKKHSIVIEGRYYYGLGSIFPSDKKDEFSASRNNVISVTLGYSFRIK